MDPYLGDISALLTFVQNVVHICLTLTKEDLCCISTNCFNRVRKVFIEHNREFLSYVSSKYLFEKTLYDIDRTRKASLLYAFEYVSSNSLFEKTLCYIDRTRKASFLYAFEYAPSKILYENTLCYIDRTRMASLLYAFEYAPSNSL